MNRLASDKQTREAKAILRSNSAQIFFGGIDYERADDYLRSGEVFWMTRTDLFWMSQLRGLSHFTEFRNEVPNMRG